MPFSSAQTIRTAISRTRHFFLTGLWSAQLDALPKWQALPARALRAVTVAVVEFFKDDCMLRASALTFYTLLSIVPIFAVMFGIAKGFGFEKMLEKELMGQLAGQEQALERILAFSRKLLEHTKGGLMAGVGVVLMFWAAIKVLGHIEVALNAMWDIRKQRTWWRRFSDYLAVMTLCPILLIVAGGVTVFIRTQVSAIAEKFAIAGMMGPLVLEVLKLSPLILICALFTLIYMVMPNTRVPFKPALGGGIIGGILFQTRPVGLHRVSGGRGQLQRHLRKLCGPAAVLCLGADELDSGAVRRGTVLRVPERGHVLQRHGVPRAPTPRDETAVARHRAPGDPGFRRRAGAVDGPADVATPASPDPPGAELVDELRQSGIFTETRTA